MSHVATTAGIKGEDLRDLMVTAVEQRFGRLNRLPRTIEWLTDNGSCYTTADTRRFAREIGFLPLLTPIESPQSNGMAEAFVRTFKRDYVALSPKPSFSRCPLGSSITTLCVHTAHLAIDSLANSPLSRQIQPVRSHCPEIRWNQHRIPSCLSPHARTFSSWSTRWAHCGTALIASLQQSPYGPSRMKVRHG
jgi:putative transposase